jgi:hypothetical protein
MPAQSALISIAATVCVNYCAQGTLRITLSYFASAVGAGLVVAPAQMAIFNGYVALIVYAIATGGILD